MSIEIKLTAKEEQKLIHWLKTQSIEATTDAAPLVAINKLIDDLPEPPTPIVQIKDAAVNKIRSKKAIQGDVWVEICNLVYRGGYPVLSLVFRSLRVSATYEVELEGDDVKITEWLCKEQNGPAVPSYIKRKKQDELAIISWIERVST